MKFYEIEFSSIPYLVFAHGYRSNHYKMHMQINNNLIEITYVVNGDIYQINPKNSNLHIPESHIWSFFHDTPKETQGESGKLHHHLSVGIMADFKRREIDAREVINSEKELELKVAKGYKNAKYNELFTTMTVILPEIMYADEEKSEAVKYIKRLIHFHAGADYVQELQCTGILIEFMGKMTRNSIKMAQEELNQKRSFSNEMYAGHATMYISKHIGEKIYVQNIADELGISYGYLSKIFKEEMGMSLVDYINIIKVERIKELLINRDVSFEDAGASVGINDVKYLSRIFKKYTGITSSEYRRQYSNQQLWSAIDIIDEKDK